MHFNFDDVKNMSPRWGFITKFIDFYKYIIPMGFNEWFFLKCFSGVVCF
jgi:hypothetical protein